MKKTRLVLGIVLTCLAALLVALSPLRAEDRPNFILLMGDDHGWEETGYNGHAHLQTPVLDRMAASGLRMDRFYAAHPSCSPTRGSVLTGRHPVRYGTFAPNWSMRPEEISIAHVLRDGGYATGHFGKWHVGTVKAGSPLNPGAMGFDEWLSHDNFFELHPTLSRNGGPPERFEGESSAIVVDETIRFIEQSSEAGKPFLAVVWFGSPHEPYSGLPEDLALYDELPAQYADRMVPLTSNETGQQIERPLGDVLRERYAEITAMDRAIGTLRDYLDGAGLRENTLLWYNGDNGTPRSGLAETPLRGLKGTMYEGGIRVPGIIEWPARIPAPRTTDVAAVTSDMLPTLAALAGQPVPEPAPGRHRPGAAHRRPDDRARPAPVFFWSFDTGVLAGRDHDPVPRSRAAGRHHAAGQADERHRHPQLRELPLPGGRRAGLRRRARDAGRRLQAGRRRLPRVGGRAVRPARRQGGAPRPGRRSRPTCCRTCGNGCGRGRSRCCRA